ncbi:hypothetical protein NO1_0267 [Candidatus Termititenax aidoneus]|uniref:YkuD domain-containing protein n=1 Tax=Termititenax aidoneus TaxID=2218524 RepID=A0A388T841_TERA1|nr:hypothetical protein NO1_0267 [Candidatus Termititenax aidoneus]
MKITYQIQNRDDKSTSGILTLNAYNTPIITYQAVSGGWGKGSLPTGKYSTGKLWTPEQIAALSNAASYQVFSFGFFLPLVPKFETDRTELGIHPDGGVPGTLGCVGLKLQTAAEAIRCYMLLLAGTVNGGIDVEVY